MTPISVKDRLPAKCGSYLVLAPQSFPKNSRWMVAEFYDDNNTFYDEGHGEHALPDVTHWCELPDEDCTPATTDSAKDEVDHKEK